MTIAQDTVFTEFRGSLWIITEAPGMGCLCDLATGTGCCLNFSWITFAYILFAAAVGCSRRVYVGNRNIGHRTMLRRWYVWKGLSLYFLGGETTARVTINEQEVCGMLSLRIIPPPLLLHLKRVFSIAISALAQGICLLPWALKRVLLDHALNVPVPLFFLWKTRYYWLTSPRKRL